jgi:uncharacterized protein
VSFGSRLVALLVGLPRASTHRVAVERDLRIPMADGAVLLADRYFARGNDQAPIILLRSPYGRRTVFGLVGRLFAERGYQTVIQSVRGTFGSGGQFVALRHEAEDGRATLEWLAQQPWFGGSIGMAGPSYLGFVQWAVAADAPDYLQALAPQITASQFRSSTYRGESFSLKTILAWIYLLHNQEGSTREVLRAQRRQDRALAPAFAHVPLDEADTLAVGKPVTFFQDWLIYNAPGDPYWETIDYSRRLDAVAAPVNLVGGWYDIFLPEQLADYAALRRAGRQPYLTIGPWTHASLGVMRTSLLESLAWFDAYLRGDRSRLRPAPVRIYVLGAKRWQEMPDWPPPATPSRWYLQPGGHLAPSVSDESPPDHYRYDPAGPTPSVGGPLLTRDAGPRDNRALEARSDVLTYTSAPLDDDLEVIGPVAVELYIHSSLEHTDFFVRLCDVAPGGRSINICDGLLRLSPGRFPPAVDGTMCLRIDLGSTACRFRRGHQLRVQVSSGAHPRLTRNLGSGEPLATATTFVPAEQSVWHDAAHPSAVVLPVVGAQSR